MSLIVQKYGGGSVADANRIRNVVVAVMAKAEGTPGMTWWSSSAMGDATTIYLYLRISWWNAL